MLMGEAGSNIYHMKIHSTINSSDNNQFILMQCILKIILFLFVSEYLRRSLVSRKSNEVLMRIQVLQGRVSASGTGTEKLGGELLALELLLLAWQSTCSAALEAPVQRGAAPEFSLNSPVCSQLCSECCRSP